MSVPSKNTVWGYLEYEGREYGILQTQFSDELREKINQVNSKLQLLPYTSAPWKYQHYWEIKNNRLYLTKLYSDEFHKAVFGNNKRVLAEWVEKMKLLIEHRLICKTYQKRGSYLNEIESMLMRFDRGTLINKKREIELYESIEMKKYIDAPKLYAFIQIDSTDLLNYLKNNNHPKEDLNFTLISTFINLITQKHNQDEISIDIQDIYSILKEGDIARFTSAKGKDIDETVDSLTVSLTDEILQPKGTIVHISVNSEFPQEKLSYIYNLFERKVCSRASTIFLFGTKIDNRMGKDEVLIRVIMVI